MSESTLPTRRRYLPELKLKIVREALAGPQSKAAIARKYDINANQVSNWIREYRDEARWVQKAKSPMVPIVVHDAIALSPQQCELASITEEPGSEPTRSTETVMTIQFASGHKLSVSNATDAQLGQILRTLA